MMRDLFLLTASILFQITMFGQSPVSNALDFDGSNDYVLAANAGPTGTSNRTVECWIKTSTSQQSQQVILDYGTMVLGSRFTLNLINFGKLRIEVGGNGFNSTQSIADGNWHHVAVTYNHNAAIKFNMYIDGVLETSQNTTVAVNTANAGIQIGRRNDGVNYFNGAIDEIRIWDIARTQSEIQNNMNFRICAPTTNLVAYYTFDQGVAGGNNNAIGILFDYSGNVNNGVLSGFAQSGNSSNFISGATTTGGIYNTSIAASACSAYVWPLNGNTYTQSGSYRDTLPSIVQCDSIITLQLTITGNDTTIQNASACQSYIWGVNNQTYTQSGQYSASFTTSLGCDSTHILNLAINQNVQFSFGDTACDFYNWRGSVYTQSGAYIDTLTTPFGCDSVVTLNLVINNSITNTETDTACETYNWILNGQTYTQSGVYTETGTTSEGCLITNELNLIINNGSLETFTEISCNPFYWNVTDSIYAMSGVYEVQFINLNGCDSIIKLDLTVDGVDTTINVLVDTLTALQGGATYQWLDCNNNFSPIQGETSQSFSPSESGAFAVEISQSSCVDTSGCRELVLTGVGHDSYFQPEISIAPNPAQGFIFYSTNETVILRQISILDLTGRELCMWTNIPPEQKLPLDLPAGVYLFRYEHHGSFGSKLITVN